MLASERTRYIISQLNKKGIINLKDVAKELGISETLKNLRMRENLRE